MLREGKRSDFPLLHNSGVIIVSSLGSSDTVPMGLEYVTFSI